jgi:hypothetical protein
VSEFTILVSVVPSPRLVKNRQPGIMEITQGENTMNDNNGTKAPPEQDANVPHPLFHPRPHWVMLDSTSLADDLPEGIITRAVLPAVPACYLVRCIDGKGPRSRPEGPRIVKM